MVAFSEIHVWGKDMVKHVCRLMPGMRHLALGLLISGAWAFGPTFAEQAPKTGGPTASPPGAAVYFVDLKDGQTVSPNLVVHFGLTNIGVAPAGVDRPNSGHHHLLIDTDLPPLDQPI